MNLPDDSQSNASQPHTGGAAHKDLIDLAGKDVGTQPAAKKSDQPTGLEATNKADTVSVLEPQKHNHAPASPEAVPASSASSGGHASFPAAARLKDEFEIPLADLVIGSHALRDDYDFSKGKGKALVHAASEPQSLAPIKVKKLAGAWHVIDGWARVMALRFQFGGTANVMVRAALFAGTEKEALYERFADEFMTMGNKKIDEARLVAKFHKAWNVDQLILAARIGWLPSKVTKAIKAAMAYDEAPRFIMILERADDPSVEYLYEVQRAREAAAQLDAQQQAAGEQATAMADLVQSLEALIAKPERFSAAEALVALGLKEPKAESSDPSFDHVDSDAAWVCTDFVAGADDQPSINIYRNTANLLRLEFLVDPATLPVAEKDELKARLNEQINKIFG